VIKKRRRRRLGFTLSRLRVTKGVARNMTGFPVFFCTGAFDLRESFERLEFEKDFPTPFFTSDCFCLIHK
jgi:hypothetical protein